MHSKGFDSALLSKDEERLQHFHDWVDDWISKDSLWCYEAYPLGADRCLVYQTACFPQESIRLKDFHKKSAQYLERLDKALDEDIPALINQQQGMSCREALPGRFQPELEANVASFAFWYASSW